MLYQALLALLMLLTLAEAQRSTASRLFVVIYG